jgi:hypothetical protein
LTSGTQIGKLIPSEGRENDLGIAEGGFPITNFTGSNAINPARVIIERKNANFIDEIGVTGS